MIRRVVAATLLQRKDEKRSSHSQRWKPKSPNTKNWKPKTKKKKTKNPTNGEKSFSSKRLSDLSRICTSHQTFAISLWFLMFLYSFQLFKTFISYYLSLLLSFLAKCVQFHVLQLIPLAGYLLPLSLQLCSDQPTLPSGVCFIYPDVAERRSSLQ